MRRAFTLIELLVAIVLLLAVIIATSKVFNTASKVSSTGEANADVLQQATVLEEQIRRDLDRICRDGYFAIHCVEVPNNVRQQAYPGATAPLLDPTRPADAIIRCDQLVFFTAGREVSARWAGPGDLANVGGGQQARAAMVRYSHGIQLPRFTPDNVPAATGGVQVVAPVVVRVTGSQQAVPQLVPWGWSPGGDRNISYRPNSDGAQGPAVPAVDPNQPEARQWTLARKAVLLADDGGFPVFYPEPASYTTAQTLGPSSAPSIFGDVSNINLNASMPGNAYQRWHWQEMRDRAWTPRSADLMPSPLVQNGWVDVASSDLDRIRKAIAPTLRLAQPVDFGQGIGPNSVSTPYWTVGGEAPSPDVSVDNEPPIGWPRPIDGCSGQDCWPTDAGVKAFGGSMPTGLTVASFTTQRDRIMRGTFGVGASAGVIASNASFAFAGWPRAEKTVTDLNRRTELLTSPTLLTNCSSFRVDWTWAPGTGRQEDSAGVIIGKQERRDAVGKARRVPLLKGLGVDQSNPFNWWTLRGFEPFANPSAQWAAGDADPPTVSKDIPWFGLPSAEFGVTLAQDPHWMPSCRHSEAAPVDGSPAFEFENTNRHMWQVARAVEGVQFGFAPPGTAVPPPSFNVPAAVDFPGEPRAVIRPFAGYPAVRAYTAVFGFNQDDAYVITPDGIGVLRDDYTPWPTQIRVTVTIHDPRLVLDRGREFQFVLDVPKRRKD
jgi:prepilin-type N-terminal cleavage/methylation domain-containing protein